MRSRRIALVLGLSDRYDREIARGVIDYANEQRSWQLFGHGWMFSPVDDLDAWEGDGIVARVARRETAERLARLSLPVVDVAGAFSGYGFARVSNDDEATGREVGRYLTAGGRTHAAFCGVDGVEWSAARRSGYEATVGARDVPVFARPLDWWESGHDFTSLARFVRGLDAPAGLFAANDSVALRVLQACRDAGVDVSGDVAVVGVDNEDIVCTLARPPLSSISLRLARIGRTAARVLDGLLEDPRRDPSEVAVQVPPGALVERDSSRIMPTDDRVVRQALEVIHQLAPRGATVADVVAAVPLSRRSLEVRFRQATGRTMHAYLVEVRLSRARSLLRETDLTVEAVAGRAGFGSVQRFFDLFRRATGVTPGNYRSAHHAGQR